MVVGDLDGDGDLDLVLGGSVVSNPLPGTPVGHIYRNDGTGRFTDETAGRLSAPNGTWRGVALGDVDGDGDLDLACADTGTNPFQPAQNRLYLNDGTGTFTDVTASHLPAHLDDTRAIAFVDVDGDGDLDLVAANQGQSTLYLNDGTGHFTDVTAASMPAESVWSTSIAIGDVDGDGDPDIVLGVDLGSNWSQPLDNRLYLNDGLGHFTASASPIGNGVTYAVALGDVDGDGDLDLVEGNNGDLFAGQMDADVLHLNDGAGNFQPAPFWRFPSALTITRGIAFADVDGDGDLDIVQANEALYGTGPHGGFTLGEERLFLNDGTGVFTDETATRMPAAQDFSLCVACADFDGDGDVDLAFGDLWGTDKVLCNLQRQLHAQDAPHIGLPYQLDAYFRYGPPSTIDLAAIYVSTAPASIPLGPFGTLGIDLGLAAPFPLLTIPQPAGVGSVGFTVPNVPGIVGLQIWSQSLHVAYPNDLRLSNVVHDVIH